MSGPVSHDLDDKIRAAVGAFPQQILDIGVGGLAPALVIKYIPAKFSTSYHQPGQKLKISETPGFTWGRATYVTPLAFPLSTAIFGRVGVIAGFNPDNWRRTFDATIVANQKLYMSWLQAQPLYRRFVLTAQSAYISQMLRDKFRLRYGIDCVLFRPDQSNPRYTKTVSDVWMAVTDWRQPPAHGIATGFSDRFMDARLTVVVEEEFEDRMGGIHRAGLLNLASTRPADLANEFRQAYYAGRIVRIGS
ncbi:MAG: hypothetical protein ACLP8X_09130 [Streptosporangiaceae bacterium]